MFGPGQSAKASYDTRRDAEFVARGHDSRVELTTDRPALVEHIIDARARLKNRMPLYFSRSEQRAARLNSAAEQLSEFNELPELA